MKENVNKGERIKALNVQNRANNREHKRSRILMTCFITNILHLIFCFVTAWAFSKLQHCS